MQPWQIQQETWSLKEVTADVDATLMNSLSLTIQLNAQHQQHDCRGEMCNLIIFCGIYWLFNAINVDPFTRESHQRNYCYFFFSSVDFLFYDRSLSLTIVGDQISRLTLIISRWTDGRLECVEVDEIKRRKRDETLEVWEQRILPIQLIPLKLLFF